MLWEPLSMWEMTTKKKSFVMMNEIFQKHGFVLSSSVQKATYIITLGKRCSS